MLLDVGFAEDELNRYFSLEDEEELPEVAEEIQGYKRVHILLSFSPEKFLSVEPHLKKILQIEGIEYEQASN